MFVHATPVRVAALVRARRRRAPNLARGIARAYVGAPFWGVACRYNDVSPLENRSIFLAARTLRSPSCNFLELVSVPGRRRFRAILCDVVLATDLTDKDREEMNARKWKAVVSSGLDVTNAAHRMALLRTFMTCADIGSTAAPFELFIRWGSRLFHELRATNPSLAATAFAEIQQGFLDKVRAAGSLR